MKSKLWNLLFVFSGCLLVYTNYELVVPKHYDHYSAWIPRYSIVTLFYTLVIALFLIVFYFARGKFASIVYAIVLVSMAITNIVLFKKMNPFNEDSHIVYKGTSWQSHYPEPFYIFVVSFIIIVALFLILNKNPENKIPIK